MSNSIHFEQLFERFSRLLDREFSPAGERRRGSMGEDSLLERVTTAAEERHLSQNTLTAYRRTWLKLIAGAAAEGLALETLPSDRAGEFYKEATRGRSASHHHLQVKAALALLYDVVGYKSIRRVPGSQILARENRAALPHCLAIGTTPA